MGISPKERRRLRIVSLDTDVVDVGSVIQKMSDLAAAGTGGYVCFATAHMVMEAHDDPSYAERVNRAEIVVPDGMPLVWIQRISRTDGATRLRANDLMIRLCGYAEEHGYSVGFLGGSEEVIENIVKRARMEFPALAVVFAHSPPFRPLTAEEDDAIVEEIARASPAFLFVGLGCPKQEVWMSDHKGKLKCVMLGVGASFDFFAGSVRESPAWLGRLGLEWLFRLWQEPRRLWKRYLVQNPRFVLLATRQVLFRKADPPLQRGE